MTYRRRSARALLFIGLVTLVAAVPAGAASVDYYLKLDGVPGEASDGTITIQAFSVGNTAGKQGAQPLSITKAYDTTSPGLAVAAASGQRFACATLTGVTRGDDGRPQERMRFTLADLIVTSFTTAASSEAPTDQLALHYSSISYSASRQAGDGSVRPPVTAGWDFLKRSPFDPPAC